MRKATLPQLDIEEGKFSGASYLTTWLNGCRNNPNLMEFFSSITFSYVVAKVEWLFSRFFCLVD